MSHDLTLVLTWFDCAECEQLEERYSGAIEWSYAAITRDIARAARSGKGITPEVVSTPVVDSP